MVSSGVRDRLSAHESQSSFSPFLDHWIEGIFQDMAIKDDNLTFLILCGGKGRRMQGQDKPLLKYEGIPMIDRVRASAANVPVLISANRHLDAYRERGAVFTDSEVDTSIETPLNGVLGGLERARTAWLLVAPGDTPALPAGWWTSLGQAIVPGSAGAVVYDGLRQQNLHLLLNTTLAPALRRYLQAGHGEVWRFLKLAGIVKVDVPHPDWFININAETDLR